MSLQKTVVSMFVLLLCVSESPAQGRNVWNGDPTPNYPKPSNPGKFLVKGYVDIDPLWDIESIEVTAWVDDAEPKKTSLTSNEDSCWGSDKGGTWVAVELDWGVAIAC